MTMLMRSGVLVAAAAMLPAQVVRMQPGAAQRFTLAAQSGPSVLKGLAVSVPGGSSRLTIDVETDVLSQDVSLWVRFGRDVEVQAGLVTQWDVTAQGTTPEQGRERIVVSAATSPPLQTGTYFIAVATSLANTAIAGTVRVALDGGGDKGTYLISTFDADVDGWGRNFPESPVPGASVGDPASYVEWISLGGLPGGYLRMNDANGDVQDAGVAPPKFLGNLAGLLNPRLEFDYRHVTGAESIFVLRVRILANGSAFEWNTPEPPTASWVHYRLPLNTVTFRRTSGQEPLEVALTNVQRIEISMDQTLGGETNGVDNFALIGDLPPATPPTTPAPTPSMPVVSTFDGGTEGWTRNYPPAPIPGASVGDAESRVSWQVEGGNPSGTNLLYREAGAGDDDFFVAPAKFLGNLAAVPNPQLEFDFSHTADVTGLGPMVVRLAGAGSSFLWIGGSPAPFGQYFRFRVPLGADFFVRESGSATFSQMLARVERLEISADMTPGPELNRLDNVTLVSSATPPLRPMLTAGPANLTFNGTAGEANPTPQGLRITSGGDVIPWSATVEPAASWLSLSATSGATPATVFVAVNLGGLAAGAYNATIRVAAGAAANSPQSVAVRLIVAPAPSTFPRITAGSVGNAAGFRPPVAGGALASLFGVNLGPAEGVATSFVSGTQTLPTSFRGVRVLVKDPGGPVIAQAPLLYVSATQINFQLPFEAAGRAAVWIVVDNNGLESAPETAAVAAVAPGLFTRAENRAVAQNQDFSLNAPSNAAPRGSALIVYLTGHGAVSPSVASGQAAPASPLSLVNGTASASIGGITARVLFLGLTPGLVGLAQANVLVPDAAPTGDQVLLLSIGGQSANGALVSIR